MPAGSAHVGLDKTASEHNTGNDNPFLDLCQATTGLGSKILKDTYCTDPSL